MKFHPMQPLEQDKHGVTRFKRNKIVDYLANGRLNDLAAMEFPQEDRIQLAQLIGYSLSGFGELNYVTDDVYEVAAAEHLDERDARIQMLELKLEEARRHVRDLATALFRIHPDDLHP